MRTVRNTVTENEVRVIDMLCKSTHRNIVQVLGHGALDTESHYYIDMELCDLNLADHAKGQNWNQISAQGKLAPHIFRIMEELVNGLMFIHMHQQVHRDLHPTNGTCRVLKFLKM